MLRSLFENLKTLRRSARDLGTFLGRDQAGGVIVFLAFAIVPLVGFIGIATDTARGYLVKSRLSSALDAAGLAGGKVFFSETRDDDIRMFFDANYPQGFMSSEVSGPDIVADGAAEKLTLSATATVPTSFMRIFGFEEMTVYAEAEVTRKMKALDVVLAIDISGSMGWSAPGGGTRIEAAKQAATDLVDILFGADDYKELLGIGLVPWNAKVNVMTTGQAFDPALTTTEAVPSFVNPETGLVQTVVYYANNSEVPLFSSPPTGWAGCVFSRYVHDFTDDNDGDIRYGAFSGGGTDWPAWQPVFPGTEPQWGGEPIPGGATCTMAISGQECGRCPTSRITPLQHEKAAIMNGINALSATGNTNIPAGLGWAWRVLKPEPPFTQAELDPEYDRDQAIVLLSDGENCAISGDGYKGVFGLCGAAGSRQAMDARLRTLALNVKADGVLLYVIQFANEGTELQALLQEIASGPTAPYYYFAPDRDTLLQAFREIANHLSQLRLSK